MLEINGRLVKHNFIMNIPDRNNLKVNEKEQRLNISQTPRNLIISFPFI